jgi:hypothetical protein
MALFVHIADARDAAAIRRSGLKLPRWRGERGIFCGREYCRRGQYGARTIRAACEAKYGRA